MARTRLAVCSRSALFSGKALCFPETLRTRSEGRQSPKQSKRNSGRYDVSSSGVTPRSIYYFVELWCIVTLALAQRSPLQPK